MKIPGGKEFVIRELFILLAVLVLIVFICRLWPILLFMIIVLFFAMIALLFKALFQPETVEPKQEPVLPKEYVRIPIQNDVYSIAYSVILRRISELVHEKYPQARWIWESSNVHDLIKNGEDVYILLNRAGGYKRAKVKIFNLEVQNIVFAAAKTDATVHDDELEPDEADELPENYELLAFEWVEAHVIELNNRCNEAIGEGKNFVVIGADELPEKESWIEICKQLKKTEIENLECIPEGIQINLTQ